MTTPSIEQTIERIEQLYRSVTGKDAPHWSGRQHAAISPEIDASEHVDQQLGRLLDAVHRLLEPQTVSAVVPWSPAVSIRRDGNDHVVDIELAGVERDTIELHVAGSVLTVSGCRDLSHPGDPGPRVLYSERPFGRFERRIPLPEDTSAGDVRAELRNGVLGVRVGGAGRESAQPRTIAIT